METRITMLDARWSPLEGAVGAMLVLAITCCGGPWGIGDVVLSTSALFLTVFAFARQGCNGVPAWRIEWVLLAGLVVLGLSQWMPMPMGVWERLPGRLQLARDLASVDVTGWMPSSLDSLGTFRGLAALMPAVALFIAMRALSDAALLRLLVYALALGVLSVLLGLMQVAGGGDAWWRMHDFHNRTGALGFFANRNHQAAFLVMLLPIAIALIFSNESTRASRRWRVLLWPTLPMLILGIALTYSRAGIALGALGLVLAIALVCRQPHGVQRKRKVVFAVIATSGIGLALGLQFALLGLLPRFAQDALHDSRWGIFVATIDSGRGYQPLGAGLGAYAQAVQASVPNRNLVDAWLNHAHNDWLEVWLELGIGGVILLLIVVVVYVLATRRTLNAHGTMAQVGRSASLSILLVGLHSMVDWPLRTGANMVLLALLVATLLRSGPRVGRGPLCGLQETKE